MKLLLDTHSFLWFIAGDVKLSRLARSLIEDLANEKFVSVASLWEIAVKVNLGKLSLSEHFDVLIPQQLKINGFEILPIKIEPLSKLIGLPFHHRDPFDRIIISQAIAENISVVSVDAVFDNYLINRVW